MDSQRVKFKVSNGVNPELLEKVVSHFEEIFQQSGLEVYSIKSAFYGTNIKVTGGDVIHADVGLNLDFTLKYRLKECKINMRGFFISPQKWPNKKWTIESTNQKKTKMKTSDLIKYIKRDLL